VENDRSATVGFDLDALARTVDGRRIGLVTHPAGWIPGAGPFVDAAVRQLSVRGFLALEHGLHGELQDGVHFDEIRDQRTGLPVFSYFRDPPTFPPAFLESEVDAVVFHAQDVSHRAYTYKQVLAATLDAAASAGVAVIILDRPTPLGFLGAWGPLHPQFFPEPLPVGIPLTLGELARFLVGVRNMSVDLQVIPVCGWKRSMTWAESGLPWVPPSPNIPTPVSALAYACTGLLQATNASEGRGTCKPFEYIGAPFIAPDAFAAEMNALDLPGVVFRPVYFQPQFNKYAGKVCGGVHLMFTDPERVDPLRVQLHLLRTLAMHYPDAFECAAGLGNWLDGSAWTTERWAGLDDVEDLVACWRAQARGFMARSAPFFLYPSV